MSSKLAVVMVEEFSGVACDKPAGWLFPSPGHHTTTIPITVIKTT